MSAIKSIAICILLVVGLMESSSLSLPVRWHGTDDILLRESYLQTAKAAPDYEVILEDSFDLENKGRGNLHYRGFHNWLVMRGEADLVGNGFRYYDLGRGLCVDLNGTEYCRRSSAPAILQSKEMLSLAPGTYVLQFALACNSKRIKGQVDVRLADVYAETFYIDNFDRRIDFKTKTRIIQIQKPTRGKLTFEYNGRDLGPEDCGDVLLDNIRLAKRLNRSVKHAWQTQGQAAPAECILNDISDASVNESTESFTEALSGLKQIYQRAIQTYDAMLSVRFDEKSSEALQERKGAENGNE